MSLVLSDTMQELVRKRTILYVTCKALNHGYKIIRLESAYKTATFIPTLFIYLFMQIITMFTNTKTHEQLANS